MDERSPESGTIAAATTTQMATTNSRVTRVGRRRQVAPLALGLLWGVLSGTVALVVLVILTIVRGRFGNLTGLVEGFLALPIGVAGAALGMRRGARGLTGAASIVWRMLSTIGLVSATLLELILLVTLGRALWTDPNQSSYRIPVPARPQEDGAADAIQAVHGGFRRTPDGQSIATVELSGDPATDTTLAQLANLPQLQELNLDQTRITDLGLTHLKNLPRLRTLSLMGLRIDGSGLKNLAGNRSLRQLYLGGSMIQDDCLTSVGRLPSLESLVLFDTQITDRGVEALARLQHLRQLDLRRTRISDAGLTSVGTITSLETLDLGGTQITDAGLARLGHLSHLRLLWVNDTQVTDQGVAALHLKLPGAKINQSRAGG